MASVVCTEFQSHSGMADKYTCGLFLGFSKWYQKLTIRLPKQLSDLIKPFSVFVPTSHFQLVGNNDEILDVKFLSAEESHLAVASNSDQIKVFELSTMNCQILTGHTGNV